MPKVIKVKAAKRNGKIVKAHNRNVAGKGVKVKNELGNTYSPKSSFIVKVSHNPSNEIMYVNFKNGSTYAYKGVPAATFSKLRKAESTGKFFHKNIKNNFSSTKF